MDGNQMRVHYDANTDLLYIRLDDKKHKSLNKRISEDIVLDIGKNGKIIGIEILDASKHLNVKKLFPVNAELTPKREDAIRPPS